MSGMMLNQAEGMSSAERLNWLRSAMAPSFGRGMPGV
jgi:hypothetical protein